MGHISILKIQVTHLLVFASHRNPRPPAAQRGECKVRREDVKFPLHDRISDESSGFMLNTCKAYTCFTAVTLRYPRSAEHNYQRYSSCTIGLPSKLYTRQYRRKQSEDKISTHLLNSLSTKHKWTSLIHTDGVLNPDTHASEVFWPPARRVMGGYVDAPVRFRISYFHLLNDEGEE